MMSKPQILKKIGNIIEELSEQQQYLASTNKINLLELELFTANADFLIDHIEILKKLNDKRYGGDEDNSPVLNQNARAAQQFEPEVEKTPLEIPAEDEQKKKFSFSFDEEPTEMVFDFEKKIAVEEVFDRPLNDDERRLLEEKSTSSVEETEELIVLDDTEQKSENIKQEEEEIEPFLLVKEEEPKISFATENLVAKEPEPVKLSAPLIEPVQPEPINSQPSPLNQEETSQPVKEKVEEKPIVSNEPVESAKAVGEVPVVKERPLTLNEMLSAKLNQTVGQNTQRQNKKQEDLKVAISINDKMVFIKELFNGYNLAYSEAIEIVNRFDSFDAADNFLQKNYSVKNDWENKQVTVARFYEYLHKKFVM